MEEEDSKPPKEEEDSKPPKEGTLGNFLYNKWKKIMLLGMAGLIAVIWYATVLAKP